MTTCKNKYIPYDECIRKYKKIEVDACCTYLIVILTLILSTLETSSYVTLLVVLKYFHTPDLKCHQYVDVYLLLAIGLLFFSKVVVTP